MMEKTPGHDFITRINEHVGIAHKICRMYFDDQDDRQDAFQEMMYQLWKSYEGFDGRSKFSTWMYSVCLNTALTFRRKQQRHAAEPLSADVHRIADEQPAAEDTVSLMFRAIQHLSPVKKAIILLYLEDLSYEEIASITGLTVSNVSVRLVRIKRELEEMIKKLNNTSDVKF